MENIIVESLNEEKFILKIKCPVCGKLQEVVVRKEDFLRWQEGDHVQYVFPYLSPDEREAMISGLCSKCFDEMF